MFIQRLMFALKGNSSAQVISRQEENFYTIKKKGTLREGFLTSWVNSKESTSFLETEYPSDNGQKS